MKRYLAISTVLALLALPVAVGAESMENCPAIRLTELLVEKGMLTPQEQAQVKAVALRMQDQTQVIQPQAAALTSNYSEPPRESGLEVFTVP
jgi:hypothetical protein